MKIVTRFFIFNLFTFSVTFSQVNITWEKTEGLAQSESCENGTPGGYATLAIILIAETTNNDFSTGGSLILIAPSDWQFNTSSTPSATILSSPTDLIIGSPTVLLKTLSYPITVSSTNNIDVFFLHAIEIQALDCNSADSLGGSVFAAPIGLTIAGLPVGTTIGYVSVDPNSVLPVELTSFSAILKDKEVLLNWSTATEVNNYGFDVERMRDGEDWNALGFVEGNGNSNSPKEYSFVDNNVSNAGTYYYRLKQIDNDGTYEFSNQIEVNFEAPNSLELNQNYPNPFNPSTTISFNLPEPGKVTLKIYNLVGEEIATLVDDYKQAGIHTFNFNAEGHPSGMYLYRLSTNGFTETKKMLFMK
ncbi:MAG: T9SS type A sorting domain-containing protein [Bacteroidetes bacterium]|nr:T9SS type A sorting domain-containing protein [Bacteroidota bacterium]